MTTNTIRCAICGDFLSLSGQTVSCAKCAIQGGQKATGTLAEAILTIETQASETGHTVDISSIAPDENGRLTFRVKSLAESSFESRLPRVKTRKQSA